MMTLVQFYHPDRNTNKDEKTRARMLKLSQLIHQALQHEKEKEAEAEARNKKARK
jgi:hypothetical protein